MTTRLPGAGRYFALSFPVPGDERLRIEGPVEQVPLVLIALDLPQVLQLTGVLDAFGAHSEAELMGKVGDG
ncbi:MAG: hypothetical protein WBM71_16695, partial [Sedimenticolaceae bacterium]